MANLIKIKKLVRKIPVLGPGLRRLWRSFQPNDPCRRLRKVFKGVKDVQVVQIGSNDGRTEDPLYDVLKANRSWRALFVEPVPFLFEKLRQNHGTQPRFRYENLAISEKVGSISFYYLAETAVDNLANLPSWWDQLGSFNSEHIPEHLGEKARPYVVATPVDTLPLQAVLERNHIDKMDLLHIDTEGSDWNILQQLDLRRYAPEVILVEHKHLLPETKLEMRHFLQDRYSITDLGDDYFCHKVSLQK